MWKPLGPDTAIETMRVVISFAEPLSSMILRKVLRELERTTNPAGLINKQQLKAFHVNLPDQGGMPQFQTAAMDGMVFQRTTLVKSKQGLVEQRLAEQLEAQPLLLAYATWLYPGWDITSKTLINLVGDAFQLTTKSVAVAALRMEYLNRFVFEGDPASADPAALFNTDTGLIASEMFKSPDLWHSHVGRFDDIQSTEKVLYQLNVDAQMMEAPPELKGVRSILVTPAVEFRFEPPGMEVTNPGEFLLDRLNLLHVKVKALFKRVLNPAILEKVGIPNE